MASKVTGPGELAEKYAINPKLEATNSSDQNGNPTGGAVRLAIGEVNGPSRHVLAIYWQDGPRGKDEKGDLAKPNGAFVEDVLWAALQRLEYFQASKYKSDGNQQAIEGIQAALDALEARRKERADRGVEGQHQV